MKLYAPKGYWGLTKEAKDEICNGCGSSRAKLDFVPDSIYGLSIKKACDIHDYMYHVGTTLADKEEADRVMRNNLIRLIEDRGGLLKSLRRWRAGTYYIMVDRYGGPAFWEGKKGNNERTV